MIRIDGGHLRRRALTAAPDIPRADDNANLRAHIRHFADDGGSTMHLIEIKQVIARFQRLAGEFEQYTFVDSHEISSSVVIPQAAKVAAFGIFPTFYFTPSNAFWQEGAGKQGNHECRK